jgi:hypothetical protein
MSAVAANEVPRVVAVDDSATQRCRHTKGIRHAADGIDWAGAGTSTKDLMARIGHDDMRAALIYEWATSDADQQIADRLSKLCGPPPQGRDRSHPGRG